MIMYIIIKALHRFLHGFKSVTSQHNVPKHPILKNASTQCGIFKKNVATQCYVNTSNTPRKQRLRKDLHRKKAHIQYLKKKSAFSKIKVSCYEKRREKRNVAISCQNSNQLDSLHQIYISPFEPRFFKKLL
ncbi:hypothetical protein Avbf_07552 [Armadillidium vulgare]|nr:hypothetical protein Avbf_07552 [Armadillidium vulgare]